VLEEAAPVGVVQRLRGGPDPQPLLVLARDLLEQRPDPAVADTTDDRLQLGPHLVERARRRQDAVLLAEAVLPVLIGVHPANVLDDQLEAIVVEVAARPHLDELAGVELPLQPLHVVEDLRGDAAGRVLQGQRDEVARTPLPDVLLDAEEEADARRLGGKLLDPGKGRHHEREATTVVHEVTKSRGHEVAKSRSREVARSSGCVQLSRSHEIASW